MRVCISVVGTHGDVFPILALAAGLKKAGHEVRFATSSIYQEYIEQAGLEFYPIQGRPDSFFGGRAGIELRNMVRRPKGFQRFWNLCVGYYAQTYLKETWEAARGFDTAVCIPWFHAAASLSEKLGAPCFASTTMPAIGIPSSHMSNPMEDVMPVEGGKGIRRTWRGSTLVSAAPYEQVNRWRAEELGLKPLSRLDAIREYRRTQFLISYSELVLPRPQDWAANIHITGFWPAVTQAHWQPPEELVRFLEEHPAPILVGFSSQVAGDPKAFTGKIVDSIVRSGKSAILLEGWGGLEQMNLPSEILLQRSIPYDWIVPKLSGFVHHGGCGSMIASLLNGVPSMAIPFGFDQMLWGSRIHELGCGPAPLEPDTFDVRTLSDSIVRMTEDPAIRENVQSLSRTLRQEDGVQNAVNIMEEVMGITHPIYQTPMVR